MSYNYWPSVLVRAVPSNRQLDHSRLDVVLEAVNTAINSVISTNVHSHQEGASLYKQTTTTTPLRWAAITHNNTAIERESDSR